MENTIHLLVFVHGIFGSSSDWDVWKEKLEEKWGNRDNLRVLISNVNTRLKSCEGVKACGERLGDEIIAYYSSELESLSSREKSRKILLTMVSFSLGGPISRYCIGHLYDRFPNIFGPILIPFHYYSFASPHLGARKVGGSTKKNIYKTMVNTLACGSGFCGVSGYELILEDHIYNKKKEKKEDPIYLEMSRYDSIFMKGLRLFQYRTLFSSSHYDIKVCFGTGSIRAHNPYPLPSKNHNRFKILAAFGFDSNNNNSNNEEEEEKEKSEEESEEEYDVE